MIYDAKIAAKTISNTMQYWDPYMTVKTVFFDSHSNDGENELCPRMVK